MAKSTMKVEKRFFWNPLDEMLDLTMLCVFTSLFAVLSVSKNGKEFDTLQVVSLSTF